MTITSQNFELLLFATDTEMIQRAERSGIHGFIVDMENKGKFSRQIGFDTQINENSITDLERVRKSTDRIVLCRINAFCESTRDEVEQVIQAGADEIFLPMVRNPEEVLRTIEFIRERCKLGILVETMDAVRAAQNLAEIPLSRVYVGLNDLAIDRGKKNIFVSVADGTVEKVRESFNQPFGFGGVTLPERGEPIPCRLLMAELVRLHCSFTFLRRSFYRDIVGHDMLVEVPRILQAIRALTARTPEQVEQDRVDFVRCVQNLEEQGK
jgi:hypothetical protein